jgi:hypothetical protein
LRRQPEDSGRGAVFFVVLYCFFVDFVDFIVFVTFGCLREPGGL